MIGINLNEKCLGTLFPSGDGVPRHCPKTLSSRTGVLQKHYGIMKKVIHKD